jgi:hypothetical protein
MKQDISDRYPLVRKALEEFRKNDYYHRRNPDAGEDEKQLKICRLIEETICRPKAKKEALMAAAILLNIRTETEDHLRKPGRLIGAYSLDVYHLVTEQRQGVYEHTQPKDLWQIAIANFIVRMRHLAQRVISGQANADNTEDWQDLQYLPDADHKNALKRTEQPQLVKAFKDAQRTLRHAVADFQPRKTRSFTFTDN